MFFGIAIVVICLVIDFFIGMKRGLVRNGFRAILWAGGTFLAVACTASVTETIIMKLAGGEADSIAAAVEQLVMNSGIMEKNEAFIIAQPAAGLGVSLIRTFVFVIMFLVMKIVSFIVYRLLVAIFYKPGSKAKAYKGISLPQRLGGAGVGLLLGIYSLALVIMPVASFVRTLEDGGAKADFEASLDKIEKSAAIQEKLKIGDKNGSLIFKGVDSVSKAAEITDIVFTVTGANAVADIFYRTLSKVDPAGIGITGDTVDHYSFPETSCELVGLMPEAIGVVEVYQKDVIDTALVDAVEPLTKEIVKISCIPDSSKLVLVNKGIDYANEAIEESMELDEGVTIISQYNTFKEFEGDIDHIFDVVRIFIASGVLSGKADYMDVLTDRRTTEALVDTVLAMTGGGETISLLVDQAMANLAGVNITRYVNEDFVDNVGENRDNIVDSLMILGELIEYTDKDKDSQLSKPEAETKVEQLKELGVITDDAVGTAKKILSRYN